MQFKDPKVIKCVGYGGWMAADSMLPATQSSGVGIRPLEISCAQWGFLV